MPFPESERVIYGETPLVQVICQIRFPTILGIGSTDPADFQERIRSEYPLYERRSSLSADAAELAQRLAIPLPPANVIHSFKTEEEDREIVLANEYLTLTDNAYERWETFVSSLETVKTALEELYRPSFYSRVGLRYINFINRKRLKLEEVTWAELMNPILVGVLADDHVGPHVEEASGESLLDLGAGGRVRIRHGLARQPEIEEFGYMIDADFFTTEKEGETDVSARLADFNRLAGRLFRWAIADRLHQALRPSSA